MNQPKLPPEMLKAFQELEAQRQKRRIVTLRLFLLALLALGTSVAVIGFVVGALVYGIFEGVALLTPAVTPLTFAQSWGLGAAITSGTMMVIAYKRLQLAVSVDYESKR